MNMNKLQVQSCRAMLYSMSDEENPTPSIRWKEICKQCILPSVRAHYSYIAKIMHAIKYVATIYELNNIGNNFMYINNIYVHLHSYNVVQGYSYSRINNCLLKLFM